MPIHGVQRQLQTDTAEQEKRGISHTHSGPRSLPFAPSHVISSSPASQALVVKNPPARVADEGGVGSIPGSGKFLEEEMTTHASILAWRIPKTEESSRLQSSSCGRKGWTPLSD